MKFQLGDHVLYKGNIAQVNRIFSTYAQIYYRDGDGVVYLPLTELADHQVPWRTNAMGWERCESH